MSQLALNSAPVRNLKSKDDLVSCFAYKKYNLTFDAKALGWFIQLAIRAELQTAANVYRAEAGLNSAKVEYAEIYERTADIEALIGRAHVVDEEALASIGLTLYSFPVLDKFYVRPQSQTFVRQASLEEIAVRLDSAKLNVQFLDYRWKEAFYRGNGFESDSIEDSLGRYTPTKLKAAAEAAAEKLIDEQLFIVDLAAPNEILLEQFRTLLEKKCSVGRKKNNDLFYEWRHHGILPFIDLQRWLAKHPDLAMKRDEQAKLLLPQTTCGELSGRTITEWNAPNAEKLLNPSSDIFAALKEGAAGDFRVAVAYALGDLGEDENKKAEEIYRRWMPRNYPNSMREMQAYSKDEPEFAEIIASGFFEMAYKGLVAMNMKDRIVAIANADAADLQALTGLKDTVGF